MDLPRIFVFPGVADYAPVMVDGELGRRWRQTTRNRRYRVKPPIRCDGMIVQSAEAGVDGLLRYGKDDIVAFESTNLVGFHFNAVAEGWREVVVRMN